MVPREGASVARRGMCDVMHELHVGALRERHTLRDNLVELVAETQLRAGLGSRGKRAWPGSKL